MLLNKVCMECGKGYEAKRPDSQFCTRDCKGVFANRRAVRGAEIYDLFMASRYDRIGTRTLKLFSAMCRLAFHYHLEDQQKRAGFQSWIDPRKVLERRPYIQAQRLPAMKIGRAAA